MALNDQPLGTKPTLPRVEITPGLKQEIINDYTTFKRRIDEIEKIKKTIKPRPNIYIVFSGSYTSEGKSWCEPCNLLADCINENIIKTLKPKGYLLWVRVGPEDEWVNTVSPFKTDPQIKLIALPALHVWGTSKRISGNQALSAKLIKDIFTYQDPS